ncbi:MAG: PHP domain-containing protein [Candidatus Hodarchaeales archaeon]
MVYFESYATMCVNTRRNQIRNLANHDTHVHSTYSYDGKSTIRQITEYCCYKLDCDAIWITEHLEFDGGDNGSPFFNYDKIKEEIQLLSSEFSRPRLFLGVEIDFQSELIKPIEEFLSSHRFDFVIGAIHHISGNSQKISHLGHDDRFYDDYFDECLAAVNSGLIDSLGHLMRPISFNPDFDFYESSGLQTVLEALSEEKIALELNTRHFEFSHTLKIIKNYTSYSGNMITLGSDAHHHSKLMLDFDKGKNLLLRSRINELTVFIDRCARKIPIIPNS